MFAGSDLYEVVKSAVPVPTELFEVGLGLVPNDTPFAIIVPPPSVIAVPPELAEVAVIAEAVVVVTVGATTTAHCAYNIVAELIMIGKPLI